jgi:5-amino-6-(5-phosphoribosylamino)uracil reductase
MTNMVASVDGQISVEGKSGDLSTPGDRALFSVLRAQADVIVAGASTVVTEQYRQPRVPEGDLATARAERGQRPRPRLCIVSGSLNGLDTVPALRAPKTATTADPERISSGTHNADLPLIVTAAGDDPPTSWLERRKLLADNAEIVTLPGPSVTPLGLFQTLRERHLGIVLIEGGPLLLGQLAPYVDEWNLSLSPAIVGGTSHGIISSPSPLHLRDLRLDRVASDEDGALFLRYLNPQRHARQ